MNDRCPNIACRHGSCQFPARCHDVTQAIPDRWLTSQYEMLQLVCDQEVEALTKPPQA